VRGAYIAARRERAVTIRFLTVTGNGQFSLQSQCLFHFSVTLPSVLFCTVFPSFSYFHFKCYALSHFLRLIQENVCSITDVSQSKMLICPCMCHEGIWKVEIWLHTFLTTALNGGEWSALCPGHILPLGKSITFIKTFFVKIMVF